MTNDGDAFGERRATGANLGAPAPEARGEAIDLDTDLDREHLARLGWHGIIGANVIGTGMLFGLLQWGMFFVLQSFLASTAIVYLLATTVWLLGSLAGLAIPGRGREWAWLLGMLAAYYALRALAGRHPYELAWLAALLPLVAVMGAYAGRFFRFRTGTFRTTKWLFFLENCGFVAGMIYTVVALARHGDRALVTGPLWLGAVVLATSLAVARRSSVSTNT